MREEQAAAAAPAGCHGRDPQDQQSQRRKDTPTTKPGGLGSSLPLIHEEAESVLPNVVVIVL